MALMCFLSALYHAALVKRWITVTDYRAMRPVDTVGSCVEIMTRAPWWRWSRIVLARLSVRKREPGVLSMY